MTMGLQIAELSPIQRSPRTHRQVLRAVRTPEHVASHTLYLPVTWGGLFLLRVRPSRPPTSMARLCALLILQPMVSTDVGGMLICSFMMICGQWEHWGSGARLQKG